MPPTHCSYRARGTNRDRALLPRWGADREFRRSGRQRQRRQSARRGVAGGDPGMPGGSPDATMTAIDDGKTTWPAGAPASGHPTALLSWLEAEHVKLTCRMAALGDL